MSTWECRGCTAVYAPGAPRCPQCGVNDPIEEAEQLARENEMAKITVHGGPSNVDAEPGEPGHIPAEGVEVEEGQAATPEEAEQPDEQPEAVDYNAFTVTDLRAELAERHLTVSGAKDELVARLVENDKARADEAEQDSAE